MYKLRSLILIALCAFAIKGVCSGLDSLQYKFHFGLSGGLSQNNSLSGDIYGGMVIPLNSYIIETNFGYTYFKNTTDFDNVKDLLYYSHGIFGEANYFLTSHFYGGVRVSLNMNFVDKASQKKYDEASTRNPPTYFTGIAGFGQLGYNLPIGRKINLRLQGQVGVQNFHIATGALYFSNSNPPFNISDRYTEEKQSKLLYNLSVGLIVKL